MFNQNDEKEKKLDWMYKGPNSLVEREEYLLGRSVDKTLEQINEEEKQKQQGLIIPKNRVEHECIPPSIRDFNKVVQAEQVDLSAKLQEDPLVAIKKREEETRRQFLQNPVQLKKLQKALKAQQAKKKKKKKKKKHSSDSEDDLETKLAKKLLGKNSKKIDKEEKNLETILIHKFEALKDKLTEEDLQDILSGKFTDSDESSEEEEKPKKERSKKQHESSSEESEDDRRNKNKEKTVKRRDDRRHEPDYRRNDRDRYRSDNNEPRREHRKDREKHRSRSPRRPKNSEKNRQRSSSSSSSASEEARNIHPKRYDSDDSDSSKKKKVNYGLVSSDGKKIPLSRKPRGGSNEPKSKQTKAPEPPPQIQRYKAKKLTEEEKDKLRREMMENAVWRDKEREHNVRKYREKDEKEKREQDFDPEFIHKQLLKSADTGSVESRIKSNLNNIQRSKGAMDKHFSRR